MFAAWPDRSRWKPETVDNKACKLEAEHEVKAWIARFKRPTAEKVTTTRAEVLAGISYTFQAGIARVRGTGDGRQLDYTSVNAVTQLGKTLLDVLPKEGEAAEAERSFCMDSGSTSRRCQSTTPTSASPRTGCCRPISGMLPSMGNRPIGCI